MYEKLKEEIAECTTESQWVIVVFIDVRSFTEFCGKHKTKEVALFVRKTYLHLLEEKYFSNILFSKPTGDGMVFVIPYSEANFIDKMNEIIYKSRQIVEDFPSLHEDDYMVYFQTPSRIGIGVSRGEACSLINNEKIIDYSGQVLNEAARLMDIARPFGIVIKNNFNKKILTEENAAILKEEDGIYLRGVAESEPIKIYYTHDWTEIETRNKIPFGISEWIKEEREDTYEALGDALGTISIPLKEIPISENSVEAYFYYPSPLKDDTTWSNNITKNMHFTLKYERGSYRAFLEVDFFRKLIKDKKINNDSLCKFEIVYPIRLKKEE